jgi:hypothetical protein
MGFKSSFAAFVLETTRAAAREAMVEIAANTVTQLQKAGPYWDGYFANEWVVRQGDVSIPAILKGVEQGDEPASARDLTPPVIPPADLRKGYTIGNQMEYRAIAMDLKPGRLKKGPGTAEQDWYTNLMEGGELIRINKAAANAAFKKGFK